MEGDAIITVPKPQQKAADEDQTTRKEPQPTVPLGQPSTPTILTLHPPHRSRPNPAANTTKSPR